MDDQAVAEAVTEAESVSESLLRIADELDGADAPFRGGDATGLLARGRGIAELLISDHRPVARQAAVDLITAIGHLNGLNLAIRLREAARQQVITAEGS